MVIEFHKKLQESLNKNEYLIDSEGKEYKITTYLNFRYGFYTMSELVINSAIVQVYDNTIPELFKKIKYEDTNLGLVWYPLVITSNKGQILPFGTNETNWKWTYLPFIETTKEERDHYMKSNIKNIPEIKPDLKNQKFYDWDKFLLACEMVQPLTIEMNKFKEQYGI